ncbi:helix-turn-helix domain-containing protein [Gluconobacter kondonii]|uniref:helix-turn-helix domain-containing protein n=1 Tax=Gluconobacter kondonii TaxID=941463 RepID=UPI0038D11A92
MTTFPVLRSLILNTFRAGQITRTAKDVLLVIARHNRPMSFETIAKIAGCSRRSVAYAVQQAEILGILERSQRYARRGRMWLKAANVYRFTMRAIAEQIVFPWQRSSKCKRCATLRNEDIKTPSFQRSRDEMLTFIASWAAEIPPKPSPG